MTAVLRQNDFSSRVLELDATAEVERIANAIRQQVLGGLRRRGAVVGLSGGIDSSLVAALCARALGRDKVLGLCMPERHSSGDSTRLGKLLAERIGIAVVEKNLALALDAVGCYAKQDQAIQSIVPAYGAGWTCKLVLPSLLEGERLNLSRLVVESPDGQVTTHRMTAAAYQQLVAATNYKQRMRKLTECYHADRLGYAVAGTPNRLEYDQGFFVKHGDGAADFKPIAHLYKTQVYALAEHLGVPEEICRRTPTTDTFSMSQTQDEFYFALPYGQMDLCLYGHNHGVSTAQVARVTGLCVEQVERMFRDIESKRRATRYLHRRPMLVDEVAEV